MVQSIPRLLALFIYVTICVTYIDIIIVKILILAIKLTYLIHLQKGPKSDTDL
jgi:hypothetical protein